MQNRLLLEFSSAYHAQTFYRVARLVVSAIGKGKVFKGRFRSCRFCYLTNLPVNRLLEIVTVTEKYFPVVNYHITDGGDDGKN